MPTIRCSVLRDIAKRPPPDVVLQPIADARHHHHELGVVAITYSFFVDHLRRRPDGGAVKA
jgi:hypothetical protein